MYLRHGLTYPSFRQWDQLPTFLCFQGINEFNLNGWLRHIQTKHDLKNPEAQNLVALDQKC